MASPALGFEGSIKLAVLVNFVLAAASIALLGTARSRYAVAAFVPFVLVAFVYSPERPQAVIQSSGFNVDSATDVRELFFSVGRSSTVLLNESDGIFELRTNGLP